MFLEILEQISNALQGSPFEGRVKTHGQERAFEICPKDHKQENSNSGIVS